MEVRAVMWQMRQRPGVLRKRIWMQSCASSTCRCAGVLRGCSRRGLPHPCLHACNSSRAAGSPLLLNLAQAAAFLAAACRAWRPAAAAAGG
jgi:hypothetical protein